MQAGAMPPRRDVPMATDDEESDEEMGDMKHAGAGSSGIAGFAVGVVFGALLGAGLALLYAPDRGEKTRRQLKRRLHRLREEAGEGFDRAGTRARKELSRRRRRLEEGIDRVTDRARDALEE